MAISQKLHTTTEFEDFIALPENADRRFELIDGVIVEKMPTEEHSQVAGNLYAAFREYARQYGGRALFEVRRRVPGDDTNTRLPDVEYTSAGRVQPVVKKGAALQIPDVCVEIKSPNDTFIELREKAIYYLKNGAKLVLLAFPGRKQVEVHRHDAPVETLGIEDTLTDENAMPGFSLPIKAIFEGV